MFGEILWSRIFRRMLGNRQAVMVAEPLEDRRLLSVTISTLLTTGQAEFSTIDSAGNVYEVAAGTVYEIPAASRTRTALATRESFGFNPDSIFFNLNIDGAGNFYVSGDAGVVEFAAGTHAASKLPSPANVIELVTDTAGDLYGVASTSNNTATDVFEIAQGANSFSSLANISSPYAAGSLTVDSSGNLFWLGGDSDVGASIDELAAGSHTVTTLANINSQDASSGFALDSSGNLYWLDGNSSIDELAVGSHNVATLVNLGSKVQLTSLFTDDEGNLYAGDLGDTLYEIPAGTHSPELFQGPSDGVSLGDVTLDNKGNLFDITTRGGTHGYGELFEISAGTHTLRVVASLPNTHLVGPPAGGGVEADATGNLYITIGDPFGSSSIVEVSGSGFVVAPSAPVIFTQPSSQSTLAGDNVTFTAVDNSTPAPTVQWQESDDDGKPFRDITGNASATTQTLRLNEVAASQNGTRYRAIFTNGLGFLVSDVVKLAVEPLVLVSPAHASESTGTSTTATLSALGDATDGEAGLTYQWSLVRLPAGAIRPTFTENGSNAARHTTVTFHKAGDYLFRCTISDGSGDRVRSDVQVEVAQEATSLRLTPHDQTVAIGKDITFHGAVYDQFGKLMLDQSSIQYLIVSGPGTIDPSSGVFSSSLPGAALIEASDGDLSGTAGLGVIVA